MTATAGKASNQDYGVMTAPATVRIERLLPGPVERVWAYLTESQKLAQWLGATSVDLRPGAEFQITFDHASLSSNQAPPPEKFKDMGCVHSAHRVLRFEPPHVLTINFGPGNAGDSEVTFELTPQGKDVLLVLTQRKLADRKTMVGNAAGWHSHLAVLIERLDGREPEAFWSYFGNLEEEYDKRIPRD